MRRLKSRGLALLALAGACLLSGCSQMDTDAIGGTIDTSVSIDMPYATSTPVPEYLNVPDSVVIDANGGVTVNDKTLLTNDLPLEKKASDENAYPTLSLGDTGLAVQSLQQRLSELGYYTDGISSIYDAATEAAVRRFEKTYGIMQTGIATPVFQAKLFSADAVAYGTKEYDTAVVSQYTTLQRGAVGSSVYALQQRLKELGYPITELTAVYDTATENAVRLFYQAYGLEPQNVAYISVQKELYSEDARPYSIDGEVQTAEADETTQYVGKVGTLVMQIQTRLRQLGYTDANPSGIFDAATEEAVKLFEQACGYEATGRMTYDLQSILFSDQAPEYGTVYSYEETVYPQLKQGDSGSMVKTLQTRLIELGYASGEGNGEFGDETVQALKLFQKYNDLEQTGIASSKDQNVLYSPTALSYQDVLSGITRSTPAPAATAKTNVSFDPDGVEGLRTLKMGLSGDDVSAVQARLNALSYTCSANGYFDDSTQSAVRAFQSAIGMPQTGEVTPELKQYLDSGAAPMNGIVIYNSTQSYELLHEGDTGDAVTKLQQRLWTLGYLLTEDVENSIGTYHDKTAEAVRMAQQAVGYVEPSGIASAEFQCFLFSTYGEFIKR